MDISDLLKQLDRQTSWRKRELYQAKKLACNAGNKQDESYLCRVWVLALYAHCDNFLKESSKHYLYFLKSNRITCYKPNLLWLAIKGKENITQASEQNYKSYASFHSMDSYELLNEELLKDIFGKRSFKYTTLRFICDWVIQIDEFKHEEFNFFCTTIKEKRDSIAHGEEVYIDKVDDCLVWHEKTISLIDSLKRSILINAERMQ